MPRNLITIDELTTSLYDEFSWRRKELNVFNSKIPTAYNPLQAAMLRSGLALLYAHWEGFIKKVMTYYLVFVSNKYLNHNQLTNTFIALSLQNKLGDIKDNSIVVKAKMVSLLIDEFQRRSNIPKKDIIKTNSNLNFSVFKEILFILDLDDGSMDIKKGLIDDLVTTRNHIAHGEYLSVQYQTYMNFHQETISIMNDTKDKILNNAVLYKYKRNLPAEM